MSVFSNGPSGRDTSGAPAANIVAAGTAQVASSAVADPQQQLACRRRVAVVSDPVLAAFGALTGEGDPIAVRAAGEEARDLVDAIGDTFISRMCRWCLATAQWWEGRDLPGAVAVFGALLAEAEAAHDDVGKACSLVSLAADGAMRCGANRMKLEYFHDLLDAGSLCERARNVAADARGVEVGHELWLRVQERPRTLSWRATPARRTLSPHIVHNIAGLWNLLTRTPLRVGSGLDDTLVAAPL
jgi:hypothetical protein